MELPPIAYRVMQFLRATLDPTAIPDTGSEGTPMVPCCDVHGVPYVRLSSSNPSVTTADGLGTSAPAAGAQASVSLPADATKKYNAIALAWHASDTAAAAVQTVVLRDGASGAGAIIWETDVGALLAGTGDGGNITFPPGFGPGNAAVNTALTFEFLAAPAGTGKQSVSIVAYKSGA